MSRIRSVRLARAVLAVVVLAAGAAAVSIAGAATITSTAAGGPWFEESTWIGGVVPGAADDVVIAGPVTVAGVATCTSVQVTAAGAVEGAQAAPPRTLHVLGPVTNAGSIGGPTPAPSNCRSTGICTTEASGPSSRRRSPARPLAR